MEGIDNSFSGVKALTAATPYIEAGEVMALVGRTCARHRPAACRQPGGELTP
jgi:ABC-type uncharacterized transport system ATPase subunit